MNKQQVNTSSFIQNPGLNWINVLEFLQDQYRQQNIKETEWLLEKQSLQQKINVLEGENKAHENINRDLVKRIKMLEFALRQERIKHYQQGQKFSSNQAGNNDFINQILKENSENLNPSNYLINNSDNVPKRRAKGHRPLLLKFLEEVGFEDIFAQSNELMSEISNISQLKRANEQDLSQNINNLQTMNYSTITMNSQEKNHNMEDNIKSNQTFSNIQQSNLNQQNQNQQLGIQQENIQKIQNNQIHNQLQQQNQQSQSIQNQKQLFKQNVVPHQQHSSIEWSEASIPLYGHLDSVRRLYCIKSTLVSISEDCMVKLWDLDQLKNLQEGEQLESYQTLREHTGPLFAISGFQVSEDCHVLYTGGSEGLIKVWLWSSQNLTENSIFNWFCSEENVWDLQHHPVDNLLLSSSSDGIVRLWRSIKDISQLNNNGSEENGLQLNQYIYQPYQINDISDINPTSIAWANINQKLIAVGYKNIPHIALFDQETADIQQVINYSLDLQTTSNEGYQQTNQILPHPNLNILIAAHDDKIRIFDQQSGKIIKSLTGHKDFISSISLHDNKFQLASVGHDNSLKIWDIRKYEIIQSLNDIHYRKYDETINYVKYDYQSKYLLTGGADSVIKVFQS